MQIRFDGTLGFPGGVVDKGETPEVAVNREMCEELGCSPDICTILATDHVMSQVSYKTQFCLHFYAKQISIETLQQMERSAIVCSDYGSEVRVIMLMSLGLQNEPCAHTKITTSFNFICVAVIFALAMLTKQNLLPHMLNFMENFL